MSKRRIDEKRLREIQMRAGNGRGPGSRFGGLKEKPKDLKRTVSQLLKYISHSKKLLICLVIVVICSTLCTLSTNVVIQNLIKSLGVYDVDNGFTTNPNYQNFMMFIVILAGVYVLYCIFQYVSTLLSAYLITSMTRKLRNDLFEKIVRFPIKYTDTHPHGDIMSRITNDIDNISQAVSSSLTSLVSGVLTIIGCLVLMLVYSPLLTCVALTTLVLSVTVTFIMSKFSRPLFKKQSTILGLLNSQTEEMVTGCKTVIAYNHQTVAEEEFNEYSDELCSTAIKAQIWGGSMGPIMNFVGNFGYFLICIFGALFLSKGIGGGLLGALEVSIVITFLTLNKQFTRPINEIAHLYSSILTALAGAERVFGMMNEEIEDFTGKIEFDPNTTTGYIDFRHIGFSYVPGKPILKDFNVDVYSGHKIALVGATGSGKTTIVNLLLRFYDIDSGQICIDGKDIMDISKKDLRDSISIVLQDAVLFGDTIENNVKYGKQDATQEEFENALKMANCYNFVMRLPDQEKTVLSQGATNISQGQRQLLTIARAFLANPKILILDEATSSVDTRTEKKIQDAMVNLMKNRTSIIIAHRLSTIQDADLIIVLDQGVIVEMGNHNDLLKKQGVYNRLYQTQFAGLDT